MRLALNFSHPALKLLQAGQIQLDYFKAPDWPDLVQEAQQFLPVRVHFSLRAGSGRLPQQDWALVSSLLQTTGTHFVNLHLFPQRADYLSDYPDLHALPDEILHQNMLRDIRTAVSEFGAERVIVENVPYYGDHQEKGFTYAVQPDVMRALLEETNSGLLLDISHARLAARALGWDEREYLQQLPLARLKELHFTGIRMHEGRWQDHLAVQAADWDFLRWLVQLLVSQRLPIPHMVALEYGGVGGKFSWRSEEDVILADANRLLGEIKQLRQAPKPLDSPSL